MVIEKQPLRQLPPSAVPVTAADLAAGLRATSETHAAFRAALADYLTVPAPACKLASSGRSALYTLLRGLQEEAPGRKQVVMPAYTCPSLPKVVLDLGLQPVYVDIVPETMRFDLVGLATAVTERTLAVCLIHPFGIPQPVEDVIPHARAAGAVVIEDAAQALGSRWQGKSVGLRGDFGLFSLGPGKPLSTGGGGIVITGNERHLPDLQRWWADLPAASASVSVQAWTRQALFQVAFHPRSWWGVTRLGLQKLGNNEASWGYTVRDLSNAQAGVGLTLLPRLETINERRRHTAGQLMTIVADIPGVRTIDAAKGADPIFLRLPLLAASAEQREVIYERLWSAGIGVGRMYERPLPAIFPQDDGLYPGANSFASRLLTLPTHYHVSADDIALMGDRLQSL